MRVCSACGSPRLGEDHTCAACGHRPPKIAGFEAFAPDLALVGGGFHPEYFAELADLEAGNFWFRARNDLIAWAMRKYAPDRRRILEVGCGTGFVLNRIGSEYPAADLAGTEIFSAGLAIAAARVPAATFYQMDARNIPFRAEFDAVGAFDVLEHVDDDVAVIRAVAAALRPGGVFLVTVPQHPSLWSPQDVQAGHVRRYTARELLRKIEREGFEVLRRTSFVSLPLPLMLLSRTAMRLRNRRRGDGQDHDAMKALRQPRAVGAFLGLSMRLESALIRRGASFPAGGSLLLVARKPFSPEAVS